MLSVILRRLTGTGARASIREQAGNWTEWIRNRRRVGSGSLFSCWFYASSAISGRCNRGDGMAYFPRRMNSIERACKIVADIFVALLIIAFSVAFFGPLGGLIAFIILEAALLAVDYLVPDADDPASVAVR